jgi:hypothetical protein
MNGWVDSHLSMSYDLQARLICPHRDHFLDRRRSASMKVTPYDMLEVSLLLPHARSCGLWVE